MIPRPRRPLPDRLFAAAAVLAFAVVPALAALTPTEWQFRQSVSVEAPGLAKIALPPVTFDHAQPGLADLRLLDPAGREVPYLLDRDLSRVGEPRPIEVPAPLPPAEFSAEAVAEGSRLLVKTGTNVPLDALELETAAPWFLQAAHVEISADGKTWESLGPALPLFRQFGAEQLRIPLPRRAAPFVRVTMDPLHSRPVAFTGVKIFPSPRQAAPPAFIPLPARIAQRDEFAGETVLTLELPGRNLPLAGLTLQASDPLFMRRVSVAVRNPSGLPPESVIAAGTVYRVALDGAAPSAQDGFAFDYLAPERELIVHIHNGDSPPLALDAVAVSMHPVNLLFRASAAGPYQLLLGNPAAGAPQYDLAAFAGAMRTAPAQAVSASAAVTAIPDYHPRDSLAEPPLPDIPLAGAPLDAREWSQREPVTIAQPGVQELELDPAALAGAKPGLGDLRLLHAGNQVPYLLERPGLLRSLALTPQRSTDPDHPALSRWRVSLPYAGLPLDRLVLSSPTRLFARLIRVYEKVSDGAGNLAERTLATSEWKRTPDPGVPEACTFDFREALGTDTLWIETDNGDNPPIDLAAVRADYPVVRLVFKAAETTGYTLAFGNPHAVAPRYDLSLVAGRLLTASRNTARLPGAIAVPAQPAPGPFALFNHRALFWAALVLAVVVLLVVVAKLLPKPPAA